MWEAVEREGERARVRRGGAVSGVLAGRLCGLGLGAWSLQL